jgi:hypothetical protein
VINLFLFIYALEIYPQVFIGFIVAGLLGLFFVVLVLDGYGQKSCYWKEDR